MYLTTTVQSSSTFKLLICLYKLNLAMFTASMAMNICIDASPFSVWLLHTMEVVKPHRVRIVTGRIRATEQSQTVSGCLLCSEISACGAIVTKRDQSWVHLVVL